jgi:NAD(P)-dependent dehydrogenase (short-subunit alcohol dehydrogenase family)
MTFTGRTAIVTGGTRGLGAAITERLVREGAHVAAIYHANESAAAEIASKVADFAGSLSLHRGDITDRQWCQSVVADVLASRGRIDHLVNNAGKLVENAMRRMTIDEWDEAVRVNLTAPFNLSQAVLSPMIEQGFGRIVMVSSVTAVMGNNVEAGYGAAKAGLHGLVRSLAREVGRKGITVNCVVPGVFETEMTWNMRPEAQEAIRQMIPVGRRGEPEELAHAVAFLLDDRAGFVTGSIVTVDGGISMGG